MSDASSADSPAVVPGGDPVALIPGGDLPGLVPGAGAPATVCASDSPASVPGAGAAPADVAIRVVHLCKTYPVYATPMAALREVLTGSKQHTDFVALDDLSFDVRRGERVGIVGANGAGKSTLLKVLSRTVDASSGQATITGSLRAVLELGTGFHDDCSGRENILMGGLCVGYSRQQLEESSDWIIDFSELRAVIDRPLRTYSSGMKLRLMYAVAFCRQVEIMIIDEALATGDGAFVRKCTNHIVELCGGGTTALLVSHNLYFLERLCHRVIYLADGRIVADGDPLDVCKLYELDQGRRFVDAERRPLGDPGFRRGKAPGDVIMGDGATGDGATGDGATGDGATGVGATGDAATGDAATGDAATGDAATGDGATGDGATGDGATGDAATGDAATGDGATGDGALGGGASSAAAPGDAAPGDAAPGDAALFDVGVAEPIGPLAPLAPRADDRGDPLPPFVDDRPLDAGALVGEGPLLTEALVNGQGEVLQPDGSLVPFDFGGAPAVRQLNLVRLLAAVLFDAKGRPTNEIVTGHPCRFRFVIESRVRKRAVHLGFMIWNDQQEHVATSTNVCSLDGRGRPNRRRLDLAEGRFSIDVVFPSLRLGAGRYSLRFGIAPGPEHFSTDDLLLSEERCLAFMVSRPDHVQSVHYEPHSAWSALVPGGRLDTGRLRALDLAAVSLRATPSPSVEAAAPVSASP